jgi:periplasmic mercuric ion binding protein
MKTVKFLLVAVLALIMGTVSFAQNPKNQGKAVVKTSTIKVSGNCDMCKARIEKAAKIDGVTKADWNDKSKVLTVVFDPAKTDVDKIQKKVAEAGHDTEKFKADDKSYSKLPGCCKYR